METQYHSLAYLFEQLGLASSDQAIDSFIKKNAPLASDIKLHQAGFWSPSQAAFLKESKEDDADWAEIVDQLDAMLRYVE
tara:strand:+ start:6695 stop:6934 length:240 start_codon:yes stop_codon:yes gene_type:complete